MDVLQGYLAHKNKLQQSLTTLDCRTHGRLDRPISCCKRQGCSVRKWLTSRIRGMSPFASRMELAPRLDVRMMIEFLKDTWRPCNQSVGMGRMGCMDKREISLARRRHTATPSTKNIVFRTFKHWQALSTADTAGRKSFGRAGQRRSWVPEPNPLPRCAEACSARGRYANPARSSAGQPEANLITPTDP